MASRLRPILSLLVAAALCGAAPATAPAASIDTSAAGLTYRAGAGEANRVALAFGTAVIDVLDTGAAPLLGCSPLMPGAVRCPLPTGDPAAGPPPCGACLVRVETGDRDDVARVAAVPAGLLVQLDGGSGDDRLLAQTAAAGARVEVRCGAGADSAHVAPGGRAAPDCEHVDIGARRGPRLRVTGPRARRAPDGRLRLAIVARRSAQPGGPVAASVALTAAGGRPHGVLARARVTVAPASGGSAVTLRLSPRARRELARRPAIRMRVTIAARDARGARSITRRVLGVRP